MPFPDWQVREVAAFNGPWYTPDSYIIRADKGLAAQNVEYVAGGVKTRFGYIDAGITGTTDVLPSLGNWLFSYGGDNKSLIVAYSATGSAVYYYDQEFPGWSSAIVTGINAAGASFASAGSRFYMSFFNTSGLSAGQPQVFSWNTISTAEPLFAAAPSATPSVSEPGGGTAVTAGAHRIGYVVNTINGYTTAPAPYGALGFTPVTFTASGTSQLRVDVAATWPPWALSISIVMSTVANPEQYYLVPGANTLVATGTNTATVLFGITDDDLAAAGTPADTYLFQLNGNVAVSHLYQAGQRMAYVAIDPTGFPVVYFSEPNNYQSLTADQHAVFLPGRDRPISGTSKAGVNYIMSAHATCSVQDTGDVPVLWALAVLDEKIGTLAPKGVLRASNGIYVADQVGFYRMDGQTYDDKPLTYHSDSEWKRINWNAAWCVEIVEDRAGQRIGVKVPLDAAIAPSHILWFDYTNGTGCDDINYSVDPGPYGANAMGGCSIIENYSTKRHEVWLSPGVAHQPILRRANSADASPYRDNGNGIASWYTVGLLPGLTSGVPREQLNFHNGQHVRIKGDGPCYLSVASVQGDKTIQPTRMNPLNLSFLTEPEPLIQFCMMAEHVTATFSTADAGGNTTPDAWFLLSYLKHYYNPGPPMR